MRGKEQRNLWWFWFDDSVKQREAIINIFSDEMKKLACKIFSPQWLLWAACTLPISETQNGFNSLWVSPYI